MTELRIEKACDYCVWYISSIIWGVKVHRFHFLYPGKKKNQNEPSLSELHVCKILEKIIHRAEHIHKVIEWIPSKNIDIHRVERERERDLHIETFALRWRATHSHKRTDFPPNHISHWITKQIWDHKMGRDINSLKESHFATSKSIHSFVNI